MTPDERTNQLLGNDVRASRLAPIQLPCPHCGAAGDCESHDGPEPDPSQLTLRPVIEPVDPDDWWRPY